ncbi:subtilisin-like protease SBT5.3 [Cucurbita moschata]|uniref:Subtilisin-like protease SBT5.3 n=1 Tax=Cucurbita moschata TaxID=3662 RepID=A0A6J1GJ49_CUCMO|nr:subtilisin-like protease SBT5.3 [Cucurbita moschata]
MEASNLIPSILLFFFLFSLLQTSTIASKKPYIVYLESQLGYADSKHCSIQQAQVFHYNLLGSLLGSQEAAKESILYSYTRSFNGFAAILNEKEAADLARSPQVISVLENRGRKLHTTNSWRFLGVEDDDEGIPSNSIWNAAQFGRDMIIANIDTGVWPESKSFSDKGYGPVPSKWQGTCPDDPGFRCNRKLIGGRYFYKGYKFAGGVLNATFDSIRDHNGHGTHTLSTAAGNFVPGANIFGHGKGTAKGGAPKARVAAYKACWPLIPEGECFDADVLAAFEAAINDGVDVISASLGGGDQEFFRDPVAIAAFHAAQQGIIVVFSAGNEGPQPETVGNVAPWEITVAASTTGRNFVSNVVLGNNKILKGSSLSSVSALPQFYPLIDSVDAKFSNVNEFQAKFCGKGTLNPKKVQGKILICTAGKITGVEKGYNAAEAGAVGMILATNIDNLDEIKPDLYFLPASGITYSDGELLDDYINSTSTPVAQIMNVRTEVELNPSPVVAAFSSRGPNPFEKAILKPDITAPGFTILASYPTTIAPTRSGFDQRRTPFNVFSGTSMACPHISAIAALLKSIHPEWSPAAIKSALMTTAKTSDNDNDNLLLNATPFALGAGHVRPNDAMDPGLVYDITADEYLNFLCARGYTEIQLRRFSKQPFVCEKSFKAIDLNYPSISIPNLNVNAPVTINRRVKNVGYPGTYVARVEVPEGVAASVEPSTLQFSSVGEEKAFRVVMQNTGELKHEGYVFGKLIWSDGKHSVGSPISMNLRSD